MAKVERPPREELVLLLQRGYRYALSLTHDTPDAEDLVQDAWTSLLSRGGGYHVGYLFAAIRNRFIDRMRRNRLVAVEPLADIVEEGTGDEEALLADRAALRQALGRLGPDEREALYLFAVEGFTHAEIATMTARPEGTVSNLITRARQRMRRSLAIPTERAVK